MVIILTDDKTFILVQIEGICRQQINVVQNIILVLHLEENNVEKGENAGYQHFLLFPQCFQKASFSGSLKVGIVW